MLFTKRMAYLLEGMVLLILLGYVLMPSLKTVEASWGWAQYKAYFQGWGSVNVRALWQTVWLSLCSVAGAGILGTGLAWLFYRYEFPLRRWLVSVAALPLALPPLVGVLAFLFLYGASGILPRLLQHFFGLSTIPFSFEGFTAVWLVHVYTQFVYFYLFVSAALQQLDGSLLEASADMGASGRYTFWRVVLPQLRPSLVSASLLVFMISMASFTAPLLFDGSGRYMTLQIFNYKTNGEREMAAAVSTVLTLICLIFLVLTEIKPQKIGTSSKGLGRMAKPVGKGWRKGLALGLASVLLLFLVLPVATIVLVSFAEEGAWTTQILPSAYTLAHYSALFTDPTFAEPIRNSLFMAALATVANVIFGIAASLVIVKTKVRGRLLIRILTALPFAIPGTVIALNLMLLFNEPHWYAFGQVLIGTYWILPLAYFIRQIPLIVRAANAALEAYDDRLTEAAMDLGASAWQTFRQVMLPILSPAILSGTLLTFVTGLGEFVSSIMLYIIDNRPISVEVLSQLRQFNLGGAAAYSVFLMGLIGLSTLSLRFLERRRLSS